MARINSGNIRNPRAGENEWIIDDTVYLVHEVASGIVRTDERYAPYRAVLDDEERLRPYLDYRDRVFLAPRPLEYYLDALRGSRVRDRRRDRADDRGRGRQSGTSSSPRMPTPSSAGSADRRRWTAKAPRRRLRADRLRLLRESLAVVFGGRSDVRLLLDLHLG